MATDWKSGDPTAPAPTSLLPCCIHIAPGAALLRTKIQAAPIPLLKLYPATAAVVPSVDMATASPNSRAEATASVPTSLSPTWLQTPSVRLKIQTAPAPFLSLYPPTMAVFPSPEIATAKPKAGSPTASAGISLLPCWLQEPFVRVKIHALPMPESALPPTMTVLPSAEIATAPPWLAAHMAPVPTSLLPCCLHGAPGAELARV